MTIDVKNTHTTESAREALNIATQYGNLIKNNNAKLRNSFKERLIYIYISLIVLAALLTVTFIFWKFGTLTIIAAVILVFDAIFGVMIHLKMNKTLQQLVDDTSRKQLVLDEEGLDFRKDGTSALRLAWNNVSAMRKFDETFCLITKVYSGPPVIINNAYAEDIKQFIQTQTNAKIEFIGI